MLGVRVRRRHVSLRALSRFSVCGLLVAILLIGLATFAAARAWRTQRSIDVARAFGATSWIIEPREAESPLSKARSFFTVGAADGRAFEIDQRSRTAFSDDDLRDLFLLKHLRKLSIPGSRVTDAGLAHLASLRELEWLALDSPLITDAGLRSITRMGNLKYLRLSNAKITDGGLLAISALPNIERLFIDGTLVTDRGLDSLLTAAQLKYLNVDRTAATIAAAKKLWAVSPRLNIDPFDVERGPAVRLRERRGAGRHSEAGNGT